MIFHRNESSKKVNVNSNCCGCRCGCGNIGCIGPTGATAAFLDTLQRKEGL